MKKSIRVIRNGLRFGILQSGTGVPTIGHARTVASSRNGMPVSTGYAARCPVSSDFSFQHFKFQLFGLLLLTLPAGVQTRFAYTTTHGTITISRYTGPGANVIIPNTVNGVPVKCIGG